MNKKELRTLQRAMKRVNHELETHNNTTMSHSYHRFSEDIQLILFELWAVLKAKEFYGK